VHGGSCLTEGHVTAGDLLSNGRSRGWILSKQGSRMHQRFLRNLETMNGMR
jgi:hypothetical protein